MINFKDLKMGESIIAKTQKLQPGQVWRNKKSVLTITKRSGDFWKVKDKFGDERTYRYEKLLQKLSSENFELVPEPKTQKAWKEIEHILKNTYGPLAGGSFFLAIKKLFD